MTKMGFQIRKANDTDYICVKNFYYILTDDMAEAEYKPGWQKDIYPTQDFLVKSIANGELYVGEEDGQLAACMIVNHIYNEGYKNIMWPVQAEDFEVFVIHALGVGTAFAGKGLAKRMARSVIELGKVTHMKAIRLDVLEGNIPAKKAYERLGFKYIDTIQMYYEDTGLTGYMLYEYAL